MSKYAINTYSMPPAGFFVDVALNHRSIPML